jgi:hypothetical protein
MTPTEAINTLYYDDMDILHIDNWRFYSGSCPPNCWRGIFTLVFNTKEPS